MKNAGLIAAAVVFWTLAPTAQEQAPQPPAKPIVEDYGRFTVGAVPAAFGYDPAFYKKYVDAHGIPVISSDKVPDAALLVARDIVVFMLGNRPDIRREMITRKFRVGVMAVTEMTTDIPEQRDRKKPALDDRALDATASARTTTSRAASAAMTDKEYWDRRARGLGGCYTTGAEENVLGYPGTRYYGEHILVHEWSHGIMSAIRTADPPLYAEIQAAYKDAMAKRASTRVTTRRPRRTNTGRKARSGGSGRTTSGD